MFPSVVEDVLKTEMKRKRLRRHERGRWTDFSDTASGEEVAEGVFLAACGDLKWRERASVTRAHGKG